MKAKVCHLTSVHPAKDARKMCTSLANAGFDVTLVTVGADSEVCNGIKIVGVLVGKPGRLHRMTKVGRDVYRKALEVDADIYHIHDSELLPFALKLKHRGKKVIFDSHEDVPADISGKSYLAPIVAEALSKIYEKYEKLILSRVDAVISVTPHMTDRLKGINNTIVQ